MINKILDENRVTHRLIEQINRTSSTEIYLLSKADLEELGEKPAWFEELLIAKCEYGKFKSLWKRMAETPEGDPSRRAVEKDVEQSLRSVLECENQLIANELKKLPTKFN